MTEEATAAATPAPAVPKEDAGATKAPTKMPEPVQRPDRQVLDKELGVIDAEIAKCKAVLDDVKAKMDKLHGDNKDKPKDGVRDKLNELRKATKVFAEQRKALFQDLDKNKAITQKLRDQSDAMQKTLKETANIKDFSTASVEKKIADLDYHLSTTPLSLKEEKEVIAQIKALNASKKMIASFDGIASKKEAANIERKALSAKLDENKKAFTAAKELEDAQWEIVKKQGEKMGNKKDERKSLLDQREKAREEMNKHYAKIRELRDAHRKGENAWRKYMDAKRAFEKERYLKEQEERKEEMKLQKLQEEGDKEEGKDATKLATLTQLMNYLSTFIKEEKEEETKDVDMSFRSEMKGTAIGKKNKGFDDDIFGTKSTKGKKGKKGKKAKAKVINYDVKTMQDFESVKVDAPLTMDEVSTAIDALKGKIEGMQKEKDARAEKRAEKIKVLEAEIAAKAEAKAKAAAEAKALRIKEAEAAAAAEPSKVVPADEAADEEADEATA